MKDVHTEHCCLTHGCKYSDDDCTVTTRKEKQSYPCEVCHEPHKVIAEYISGQIEIDGVAYQYDGKRSIWSFVAISPTDYTWTVIADMLPRSFIQRWAAGYGHSKEEALENLKEMIIKIRDYKP